MTDHKKQRYKLTVEYDGRPFCGWQRQADVPTVQETIENAIKAFCPNDDILVQGSGRTDAGVHAVGQVAHVDISRPMTADKLQGAINFHLRPHAVSIVKAEAVSPNFNARFCAEQRHYTYRIINRRAPLTFERGLAWHVRHPLDVRAMHDAAQVFVGTHDFTTFRAVACQSKSPIKTIDELSVERIGDAVLFHAHALSFLHNQIRSFIGTLKLVGDGAWGKTDVVKALKACRRDALGLNAPPDGLYFMRVDYPE